MRTREITLFMRASKANSGQFHLILYYYHYLFYLLFYNYLYYLSYLLFYNYLYYLSYY